MAWPWSLPRTALRVLAFRNSAGGTCWQPRICGWIIARGSSRIGGPFAPSLPGKSFLTIAGDLDLDEFE